MKLSRQEKEAQEKLFMIEQLFPLTDEMKDFALKLGTTNEIYYNLYIMNILNEVTKFFKERYYNKTLEEIKRK